MFRLVNKIIFTLICGLLTLLGDQNSTANTNAIGRFQLLAVPMETMTTRGPYTAQTVYRIDTVTGDTWRLISRIPTNSALVDSWMYVLEPEEWAKAVQEAREKPKQEPPPPHKRNEHGWIGLEPLTSPTNQPHTTR